MSRIFVNYRRQDSEGYVGRLYDHLIQHFERADVFMDVDDLAPGADFVEELDAAVAACDVFIAVIGPQWGSVADADGTRRLDLWNDFVRIEISSALRQGKRVIPVLVGQARMPSPHDLPEDLQALARRNAIELSHQRFSYDMGKLVEAIRASLPEQRALKPGADSETLSRKESELRDLRDQLVNATDSPLYAFRVENRLFPVFGEGNPDANILFIGEAPGKNEADEGRPFVGPSGEVLAELLAGIGLRREDTFVTNLLLDRPPTKREPTPEEIAYYAPFVDRLIDIIRPAVLVPLGRYAMTHLLKQFDLPEKRGKIGELHGKLIKAQAHYGEIHLVPMYHPAVVLYSASQKELLRKDFEKLRLFV
jgi:DNA polymerase